MEKDIRGVTALNTIILIGACVGALVTIVTACVKVIRISIKVNKWIEDEQRHTKENYLDIKRLIITSPYMPLNERIKAGDEYIKANGNGGVKLLYQELLEQYKKENHYED